MSIAEKLTTIAENVPKVYQAGVDEFWKDIVKSKVNWAYAFVQWGHEYLRPPVKITPANANICQMFASCPNLKVVETTHFDLSQVQTAAETGNTGFAYAFYNCGSLEEVQDLKIGTVNPVSVFSNTFNGCRNLHTIGKLTVAETTKYSNAFTLCNSLQNIEFAGTIGQDGLNLQWSPLSKASIENIIDKLSTTTSGLSITLKKSAVNTAFETAEGLANGSSSAEWFTLVGSKTNWTISLV